MAEGVRSTPGLEPYRPPRRVAEGLHCVEGWWGRSPLGRRMTVAELGGGALAVFSAIRMDDRDMAVLDALGRVTLVVVPSALHASEAPWYAERYPAASVLAPRVFRARLARRARVDGTIEDDWPSALRGTLDACGVAGLRVADSACFHAPSRTLVLNDLCFNFAADRFQGLTRMAMRLNGASGRFGPTRLLRWVLTRDRRALAVSVRRLLEWDFDRVVVSHGSVLERDGKARLVEAFRYLLRGSET